MENPLVPLNELKRRIQTLVMIDDKLSKYKIHEAFKSELKKLFLNSEVMPYPRYRFSPQVEDDENIGFYRVSAFKNFDKNNLNNYSYPPESLTKRGRCNLPKYPVFYCSGRGLTSLIEFLKANPMFINDELYLSEWIITKRKFEWKVLSFILSGLPHTNESSELGKKLLPQSKTALLEFMNQKTIQDYIDSYHEIFTSESHFFPSLLVHQFLYVDEQDMVMYPSIANSKLDCNFAINANLIDSGLLKISKIFSMKISDKFLQNVQDRNSITVSGVAEKMLHDELIWQEVDEKNRTKFNEIMF